MISGFISIPVLDRWSHFFSLSSRPYQSHSKRSIITMSNIYANIRSMKWPVIDKTRVKWTYSSLHYSSMHALKKGEEGNALAIEYDMSSIWMNWRILSRSKIIIVNNWFIVICSSGDLFIWIFTRTSGWYAIEEKKEKKNKSDVGVDHHCRQNQQINVDRWMYLRRIWAEKQTINMMWMTAIDERKEDLKSFNNRMTVISTAEGKLNKLS